MKEFIVTVNEKGFILKVTDKGLLKAYAECTQDLIRCKDCGKYEPETKMCEGWGSWTEPDGYCYKSERG